MAPKVLLVANSDWYLFNFRLSLAHTLQDQGWEPVLVSPRGPFSKELATSGFRWLPISLARRGILPHTEWQTLRELQTIYREEQPDLVHHHTVKPVIYGTLAARRSGIRAVVNSITGLGYVFLSRRIMARALRQLVRPAYRYVLLEKGTRVIFENQGDRDFFLKRGLIQESQVTLIEGVGVDLEMYRPSDEAPGIPLVVMPSRMLWDKGVGEFVRASKRIVEEGSSARFALAGAPDPGNPSSIASSRIEKWTRDGDVEWWGFQSDMPSVFAEAHIVVLPSYFEGTPTVLLEAAASARPVVATDIHGIKDVVTDGETGLLVPVGDVAALQEAMAKLIADASLRRKMGRKAREVAEQRFGQDKINARTIEVYEKALESAG